MENAKTRKKSLNNPTFNLDNNNFYIYIDTFLLVLFSIFQLILFDSILLLVVYYYFS